MSKEELTAEDVLNVTGSMFSTMLDYVENSTNELSKENKQLKDNWNKLKEYLEREINFLDSLPTGMVHANKHKFENNVYKEVINKMQELEKEDSNE